MIKSLFTANGEGFDVRDVAEDLAARIRQMGADVEIAHSGSAAGKSSYLRVQSLTPEIRVSDHSKGAFQSQFYLSVFNHDSYTKVYELVSQYLGGEKTDTQLDEQARRRDDIARAKQQEQWLCAKPAALREGIKRLAKGKQLSKSSIRALMEEGMLPISTNSVEVVTEGRFIGKVEEVTKQFVVQNAGRGRMVAHESHRFAELPKTGDVIDLQHRAGKVTFGVEKDKGRGNER